MRRVLLTLIAVSIAGTGSAAARTQTGLHGLVTRGPITPVCRADDPCDEPAANVTLSFVRPGRTPTRVRTNDAGAYRVTLRAGVYTVRVRPPSKLGSVEPRHVRVLADRMRRIDFAIDTGIR